MDFSHDLQVSYPELYNHFVYEKEGKVYGFLWLYRGGEDDLKGHYCCECCDGPPTETPTVLDGEEVGSKGRGPKKGREAPCWHPLSAWCNPAHIRKHSESGRHLQQRKLFLANKFGAEMPAVRVEGVVGVAVCVASGKVRVPFMAMETEEGEHQGPTGQGGKRQRTYEVEPEVVDTEVDLAESAYRVVQKNQYKVVDNKQVWVVCPVCIGEHEIGLCCGCGVRAEVKVVNSFFFTLVCRECKEAQCQDYKFGFKR